MTSAVTLSPFFRTSCAGPSQGFFFLMQQVQEKELGFHLLAKDAGHGYYLSPKFEPLTQKPHGVRAEKPQKTSEKRASQKNLELLLNPVPTGRTM